MINPKYLLRTTSQLLSEVTKLKHNYSEKIEELNRIIFSQKSDQQKVTDSLQKFALEKIANEKLSLQKELNALKAHSDKKIEELEKIIEQQKTVIQTLKSELDVSLDSKFSVLKSQNDEFIASLNILMSRIDSIEKIKREQMTKPNTNQFEFNGNSFDGIFNYLRNNSNINDEVKVTRSSNGGGIQPLILFEYNSKIGGFCTGNEPNPWICFELKKHHVIPTYYTIREDSGGKNNFHLRCWEIQGSNDNIKWKTLDSQVGCSLLNDSYAYHTFQINNQYQSGFKYIRIFETGPTWRTIKIQNYLCISAFEIFGQLL